MKEYLYSILLAEPENPYIILCDGYSGDGGIPGYIFAWLVPNDYTISHLPVALAHETNHNVRFQFIKWKNDITLGEMMVSEGLAENFATHLYGEDKAGPWVTKTDLKTSMLIYMVTILQFYKTTPLLDCLIVRDMLADTILLSTISIKREKVLWKLRFYLQMKY